MDSQKITSFFPQAVEEVLTFLKKNMRIGLKIDDARHQELWEIPKVALREAVINAIVHTDYSLRGAPIRIAIFHDRIEIENSALLPWGLTFADLKSGVSKLRNPVIARIFHEIGLIEQWGSGIKRMTKACLEAGLDEPIFEEIGPRIRVTFFKGKVNQPIIDDLDQIILELLSFCGSLSTSQITNCVNISRRSVINRLSSLVNKGQVIEIAQSPNDPKKQYSLRGEGGRRQKKDIIKWVQWDYHGNFLIARIELGQNGINFNFSRNVVDDYFLDKGSTVLQNEALDKVKEVVVSEPIFEKILLNALADRAIQTSFSKKEIAKYDVNPKDFQEKDYRKL